MTDLELARMQGEVHGLRLLLGNTMGMIAATVDDLSAYLGDIQAHAVAGILRAAPAGMSEAQLAAFRAAAARVVSQTVEEIEANHTRPNGSSS